LANGVDGTSIEAIAERAGVSKATLYKHFTDKAALFDAGVAREMQMIEAAQNIVASQTKKLELTDTLRDFGLGIMNFLISDHAVDFYNSLSGELRRHPNLAAKFYAMGPGRTRANLACILAAATARGEISIEDPEQAAEHLFGLWQGFSNFQLSLGIGSAEIKQSIAARVEKGIALFLKAYAPTTT
jgi:TetR/AcrR family transcriptional repressor of mexJK operon